MKYDVYKIPGRVNQVPDRVWFRQVWEKWDYSQFQKYLEILNKGVSLPDVRVKKGRQFLNRFVASFTSKVAGHSDYSIVKENKNTFYVFALGCPCWVVVLRSKKINKKFHF